MKKILLLIAALSFYINSFSQTVPKRGFYGGLGGSFNIVQFSSSEARTFGFSDVYIDGSLVAQGAAGGPFEFPEGTDNAFGPTVQLGFYQHFGKSKWLWGSKLTYSYIGSTITSNNLSIPQFGANTAGTPFTGVAVAQEYQNRLDHHLTLTPYIGVSMNNTYLYLGAGASLSQMKEDINGVVGYAFIQGQEVDITGAPTNFSSNNWTAGLTGVIGGTYFIGPTLFLDLSYTFDRTLDATNDYEAPFANASGQYATSGKMIGSTVRHMTSHSFTLSVNKIF